jgi:magnesium transporter
MITNHKLDENIEITQENIAEYLPQFKAASPVDLADLIMSRSHSEGLLIFNSVPEEKAVLAFEYLHFKTQMDILYSLSQPRVAKLLNALSPDDRTTLLEGLSSDLSNQLIQSLSPLEREISTRLLSYPKNSVGRLMTTDYIAVKLEWTIQKALDYIRDKGHDSETINVIYAIDDKGMLVDDFRIRQLLFAPLNTKLEEIADRKYVSLNVMESQEEAIRIFRKYGRNALPVVDNKNVLLGIVTFDDILAVATEEDTEDAQKIGGTEALKYPYMEISFPMLMQKRAGWLVLLFLGELLTATAMGYYEDEIAKAVVLALFLPLIVSSGGNAGSQASSLIVRALALGEISWNDWWKISKRELLAGLVLGGILGAIGFIRVCTWSFFSDIYGPHWLLVAMTIALSLLGVVLLGTLSGALMPIILKRFKFDPATASAPLVATFVDVAGIVIYFNVAMYILKGAML